MATSIVPTVGRVVWVVARKGSRHFHLRGGEHPKAAVITRVVNPKGVVEVEMLGNPFYGRSGGVDDYPTFVGCRTDSEETRLANRVDVLERGLQEIVDAISLRTIQVTIHDAGTGEVATADDVWAEWMPAKAEEIAKKAGLTTDG